MTPAELVHRQDAKVVKGFYRGMELFNQGCDCPPAKGWGDSSPERMGWLAAQEMDGVKKRWLSEVKEQFIERGKS